MKLTRLMLIAACGAAFSLGTSAQGLPSQKMLTVDVAQNIAPRSDDRMPCPGLSRI